jgi:hypothetical protein
MVLPLPRTNISFATGPVCFLAQMGSAVISRGLSTGVFPAKVTVPVMVDWAPATPGQMATAASTASRNPNADPRMLGSSFFLYLDFVDYGKPRSPSTPSNGTPTPIVDAPTLH